MIWTLVCFAITFFVLKKFAFGPIQKTIDERRDRIRSSVEEAEHARAEARRLLEEHKQLIGQAKGEAGEILAEARKVADSQRERAKEEIEADRQRRLEETRKQIEAETVRALEQIRAEVAELDARRDREGDRQGARPRRPPQADRGRDRRPRLLACWSKSGPSGRRAPPVRTVALRGREGATGRLEPVHERARRLRRGARGGARAAAACSTNPELDPAAEGGRARRDPRRRRRAVRNFLACSSPRRDARAQIDEIYREFEALVAAEQKRLTVELTTAYELSDDEAASILKKIEKSSGRAVEATRKVDAAPDRRHRPPGRLAPARRERPAAAWTDYAHELVSQN